MTWPSSPSASPLQPVLERIRRLGPISFEEYQELALYGEGGFFTRGGGAGRRRDFITSPEVGRLFATVLGRALDAWWEELGRPDPFMVVEAGAGAGALAAGVREASPACSPALRYVLVERSAALRTRQGALVPLDPPGALLRTGPGDGDDESPNPLAGTGPVFTSLAQMPGGAFAGVVVANEVLDNLPVVVLHRGQDGWEEVRVGEDQGLLGEVLVPAQPGLAAEADRLAPTAAIGARIPLQHRARDWLAEALARVERGRVVVVDYADTTSALAARPWKDWLRTYRAHGRGGHPLSTPGQQDLTCDVAVDQLARVRAPTHDRSQAEFLAAHGLGQLVDAARATWREQASIGDLAALKARSLVGEADALTDPAGLGAFRVLEWVVP